MTNQFQAEIRSIERQARRNRQLFRMFALVLTGLGVVSISMLIPVWGGIQYAVYMEQEGVPEFRLNIGFLVMAGAVVLLGLAWYFYYRAPHLENMREAHAKAEVVRRQARHRMHANAAARREMLAEAGANGHNEQVHAE